MSFNSNLFEISGRKGLNITNEDIINFYILMKEVIKQGYEEIPPAVVSRLENDRLNRFITNIITYDDTTIVEYTEDDTSIVEYHNKTGLKLREIIKNSDGIITNILTYDNYEFPDEVFDNEENYFGDSFIKEQSKDKVGEQMVISSARNRFRAGQYDEGFTGNWLYCDKYHSSTFEEFIKNLAKDGFHYDEEVCSKMVKKAEYLYRHNKRLYKDNCAKHVFDVLRMVSNSSGEPMAADMESQDAYKNAFQLSKNKNFKEVPYNIVSKMDLRSLPKGCIIVYDAYYKKSNGIFLSYNQKYHVWGHMNITTGGSHAWGGGSYSVYDMIMGRQKTHIRVFIPVKSDSGVNTV